jgi:hypothetical protein
MLSRGVLTRLLILLTAAGALGGCASVPDSSPVQVLRRVTEGDGPALPPGPNQTTDPLELVRGFITASASSQNRHAAARLFLTPSAQSWDDTASVTILGEPPVTTYAQPPGDSNHAIVRLHGTQLGRLNPDGSFVQDEATVDVDFQVSRSNGQWRIAGPPPGAIVRLADFRANYKAVKVYFLDPIRHSPVSDRRYLAANPVQSMPSRVMEKLFGGPCDALSGAVVSALPSAARLRSNIALDPQGAVTIDLTELGDLDDGQRRLIAEQVLLSMSEVNINRVRLLDDGAPLLANQPNLTRDMFVDFSGDGDTRMNTPGLVVINGSVRTLIGRDVGGPVDGPTGDGGYQLSAATMSADGQRIAAINRQNGRQLLVGRMDSPLAPTGVSANSLTRPTWTPSGNEVWSVRDGTSVARVVFDQSGKTSVASVNATELTIRGSIEDLRLSRDGLRLAAIVGGQLAVGVVSRTASGDVAIHDVQIVRPELTELMAVDWRADDELAVAGRRPDRAVAIVSVDGLDLHVLPSNNLTVPLSAIASAPGRPLLVTDRNGLWSFGADEVGTWRQIVVGGASVAGYPG